PQTKRIPATCSTSMWPPRYFAIVSRQAKQATAAHISAMPASRRGSGAGALTPSTRAGRRGEGPRPEVPMRRESTPEVPASNAPHRKRPKKIRHLNIIVAIQRRIVAVAIRWYRCLQGARQLGDRSMWVLIIYVILSL